VEYIGFAVEGAKRMQTLIADLLRYSRVNARGWTVSPTDCGKVLAVVLRNLQLKIEDTQAKIIYGDLPTVRADETQLAQVFQNLIENALKFRQEGRPVEVRISAEKKENDWVFCVQDNGIGIAPEFYKRIFVIFQRLHTRRYYDGNGIGLAIIKRIVERYGGKVWVESRVGEGSAFYFTLPIDGGTGYGMHE
jgi:light-regulated signal transduction histidine kinase (bacteriophytochrome)